MSGAGKSLVLRVLEDMNFFCIDNLPPALIPKFAELCQQIDARARDVALVVDIRGGSFFEQFALVLKELKEKDFKFELMFLDCSDEKLVQRYKETRRKHPLAPESRIINGILMERQLLEHVKTFATNIIDTSDLKSIDLQKKVTELLSVDRSKPDFNVTIVSFGFKHGVPLDADMIFDARFLINPFYVEELKYKSGNVKEVGDYIMTDVRTEPFLIKLEDMLLFLLPEFIKEKKAQLIVGIGCTGGMHRSVFISNKLTERLRFKGYKVEQEHRDIVKNKT